MTSQEHVDDVLYFKVLVKVANSKHWLESSTEDFTIVSTIKSSTSLVYVANQNEQTVPSSSPYIINPFVFS